MTLDSRRAEAEALAIRHDRIFTVGTNREVLSVTREGARIWDLQGATVLPGFTDCHTHLVNYGLELFGANLRNARSIAEIQDILRKQRQRVAPEGWVLGYGWDQEKLVERRFPNRSDLDAAVRDKPCCIFRICGHVCVANSQALTLARITGTTTTSMGGVIDRHSETGEPTGILRENAMNLVLSIIPTPDDRAIRKAISLAIRKANAAGLTSVHCVIDEPQYVRVLQDMNRPGELKLRIYLLIPDEWLASASKMGISTGFGDEMLRVQGVKIFTDGSLGARTAALERPYSDDPTTTGVVVHPQNELNEIVESAARHGLQVAIHAIGDRAIAMALTAIENAKLKVRQSSGLRHRIEHASVLNRQLVEKIMDSKVITSVQPHFIVSDTWVPERVGPERATHVYALKSLAMAGTRLVAGSDCPVEPIDPLQGIFAAVAPGPKGYGQRVDARTAVEMFTKNSAYATHEEKLKGTIEVGKLADLVILDGNPLRVPPEDIRKIKVLATIVGGKLVYASKRLRPRVSGGQGRLARRRS